jgi:ubiquinol-cytochrome c reductase iron-sulfur subunit
MSQASILEHPQHGEEGGTRRDFLYLATATMGAVGTAIAAWPFIESMNPAADVLALSSVEIDLAPVQVGQRVTVNWRGSPLFIDHRTPEQIARAQADDAADLPDPESDSARVEREEWLIVVGVCTHLGCIPMGQRAGDPVGRFGGWLCACHGSHYDTSARIRRGPAPKNLVVPPYEFLDGQMVKIG